jgi:hypothetical protein
MHQTQVSAPIIQLDIDDSYIFNFMISYHFVASLLYFGGFDFLEFDLNFKDGGILPILINP